MGPYTSARVVHTAGRGLRRPSEAPRAITPDGRSLVQIAVAASFTAVPTPDLACLGDHALAAASLTDVLGSLQGHRSASPSGCALRHAGRRASAIDAPEEGMRLKEIYDWVPWFKELGEKISEGGERYLLGSISHPSASCRRYVQAMPRSVVSTSEGSRRSCQHMHQKCDSARCPCRSKICNPTRVR